MRINSYHLYENEEEYFEYTMSLFMKLSNVASARQTAHFIERMLSINDLYERNNNTLIELIFQLDLDTQRDLLFKFMDRDLCKKLISYSAFIQIKRSSKQQGIL